MGYDQVALAKYTEVERINHVHTPGNSSGIVDGASLIMLGSEQAGKDLGLTPRARVLSIALTGTEPTIMLTGPGTGFEEGTGQGWADHGRHRPGRDQRGLRVSRGCACSGIWMCPTRS